MGHIIEKRGVFADPKKLEAMALWPCPKNLKELRGFLGLTGYYRRFIKEYGVIARPLYNLLKKGTYHWNEVAEQAFITLKKVMTMPPVLTLPNAKEELIIETDACDEGICVVLM